MSQAPEKFSHPAWSYQTNIYEVNLRQYTQEGTLAAFAKELPRLRNMGVEVLWFMPIHPIGGQDRIGTLGSYYSIRDYKAVNREFGTLSDFKNVVQEAHRLHFKVIIDFVANHTANDHPWVSDHPGYYNYHEDGSIIHPHGWTDVSELNFENKDVWNEMAEVLEFWVKECDIDGYRCDMAHLVSLDFWIWAREELSGVKKDLFWLAESEEPKYQLAFDASYTWKWMHASEQFYQGKMDLLSLATVLYKSVTEFPETAFRLYFTSNHDENSWNGTEYEKYGDAAKLFAVFSCTWNGVPLIYSGQELPNYKRLKFFERDPIEWTGKLELHDFYKRLLSLRTSNKALRAGDEQVFTKIISHPEDHIVFSYLRSNGDAEVLTILNCSGEGLDFSVAGVNGLFRNVFGGDNIHFTNKNEVYLHPWGYLVFEKIHKPAVES